MPYQPFGQLPGVLLEGVGVESANVRGDNIAVDKEIAGATLNLSPIKALAATTAPTEYPVGYSVMFPSSDTSWPAATSLVETYIYGAGSDWRIRQTCVNKSGSAVYRRHSADGITWGSWQLVTPYTAWTDTSTAYSVVAANTWEIARTLTVTTLPKARFDARVVGHVQGHTYCPNIRTDWVRVAISRDGGTTYSLGKPGRSGPLAAAAYQAFAARDTDSGTVTGNVIVRIEVNSNDAATSIDDLYVGVDIYGVI